MLAGTVYFYDDNEILIKEMDLEEYEDLKEEESHQLIGQLMQLT